VKLYLGIDDTDNADSVGTGRLSRMLADELEAQRLVSDCENTRHQFLIDPAIPYTSHNSSACISAESVGQTTLERVARAAVEFLEDHFHEGANPGLCIAAATEVPEWFVQLGLRAQREVIELAEVRELAAQSTAFVWWGGETGQGLIGALGGVGLRSTGRDGRFIALRGIRELHGVLRAGEIVARSGVDCVESETGELLSDDTLVDTRDWVRPVPREGRRVMRVRREGDSWVPAEHRTKEG
jgi:tRNA(Ile2) C34 agmatinyltransferase TiaS